MARFVRSVSMALILKSMSHRLSQACGSATSIPKLPCDTKLDCASKQDTLFGRTVHFQLEWCLISQYFKASSSMSCPLGRESNVTGVIVANSRLTYLISAVDMALISTRRSKSCAQGTELWTVASSSLGAWNNNSGTLFPSIALYFVQSSRLSKFHWKMAIACLIWPMNTKQLTINFFNLNTNTNTNTTHRLSKI